MTSPPRRLLHPFISLLIVLTIAPSALADWVGNVRVSQPNYARMGYADRVYVDFDYEITTPAGARIGVHPFNTEGSFVDYFWSPSPLFTGSGTGQMWFRGDATPAFVNQVRLYVNEEGTNDPLLRLTVPTHLYIGEHGVFDITFSHDQPSWLARGENLVIDFNATTTSPSGVHVFMRPFTDGVLTPGYGASGGAFIPTGTSPGTQWFTFNSSDADVDAIRVQIVEGGGGPLLEEFFVPVDFGWREHGMKNVVLDPPAPAWLPWDHHVVASFDYHTVNPGGIHGWAYGLTGGGFSPNGFYEPSLQLPAPGGSATRFFSASGPGTQPMDAVRLVLDDDGGAPTQFLEDVSARYHFGPHAVYNIAFSVPQPAMLDNSHQVDVTFDYSTTEVGGVRVFLLPYTDGSLSPGSVTAGSPIYPVGDGSGGNHFRIFTGQIEVDQLRVIMTNADQSVVLLEFSVNMSYFWGVEGVVVASPPQVRAVPQLGFARPNPFNPATTIDWLLPEEVPVKLRIFDPAGRLVRVLVDETMGAGPHQRKWDGRDESGRAVASGVYYYQLTAGEFVEAKKMTLVR